MHYPDLTMCRQLLFPLIRAEMVSTEPAPNYEFERLGLEKLKTIFDLMQSDRYEQLLEKAAYMFCSIIDGHPFSNGNKRMAVAALSYFLLKNGCRMSPVSMEAVRAALRDSFPALRWETVHSFTHAHEYFLYHLALVVADRNQKGKITFRQEQEAVRDLLGFIAEN